MNGITETSSRNKTAQPQLSMTTARERLGEFFTSSLKTMEEFKRNNTTNTKNTIPNGEHPSNNTNVGDIGNVPISMEHLQSAVRVMFGSCTAGVVTGSYPEESKQGSSPCKLNSFEPMPSIGNTSSSWCDLKLKENSANQPATNKISTGQQHNLAASQHHSSHSMAEQMRGNGNSASYRSSSNNADDVYAQLFWDDQRPTSRSRATPTSHQHQQQYSTNHSAASRGGEQRSRANTNRSSGQKAVAVANAAFGGVSSNMAGSPSMKRPNLSLPIKSEVIQFQPFGAPAGASFSFDDGISAISAHTLEEMDRIQERNAYRINSKPTFSTMDSSSLLWLSSSGSQAKPGAGTPNSTHTPRNKPFNNGHGRSISLGRVDCRYDDDGKEENDKYNPAAPSNNNGHSPVGFRRGRSYGSQLSRRSKDSRSTQTSEFASVWRRDEKKYWEDVVEQQDSRRVGGKARRKNSSGTVGTPTHSGVFTNGGKGGSRRKSSSSGMSHSRDSRRGGHHHHNKFGQDLTITTASCSSIHSGFSSHHHNSSQHPHDSYHFDEDFLAGPAESMFSTASSYAKTNAKPGSGFKGCLILPDDTELAEI